MSLWNTMPSAVSQGQGQIWFQLIDKDKLVDVQNTATVLCIYQKFQAMFKFWDRHKGRQIDTPKTIVSDHWIRRWRGEA